MILLYHCIVSLVIYDSQHSIPNVVKYDFIIKIDRSNLTDRFATTDSILDEMEYWPEIKSRVHSGNTFETKVHFQARLDEFR